MDFARIMETFERRGVDDYDDAEIELEKFVAWRQEQEAEAPIFDEFPWDREAA